MKKPKRFLLAVTLVFSAASFMANGESTSKLAKTEILGQEYYVYEAKKGESAYGVAKRYGWDLEELLRLNPDAARELQKGTRIYYPTGQVAVVTEMPATIEIDSNSLEPIRHKVKKGENVYSISRQYGVPLEVIYKNNPAVKKGVTIGETLVIPQSIGAQYYYYTVKRGDSLSGIANKYNTTVEDILRINPGLPYDDLKEGEVIRISINSNVGKIKKELVAENKVTSIKSYKVSKGESWEEIAQATGVNEEILKEANENTAKPKENTVVNVPIVESSEDAEESPVSPTTTQPGPQAVSTSLLDIGEENEEETAGHTLEAIEINKEIPMVSPSIIENTYADNEDSSEDSSLSDEESLSLKADGVRFAVILDEPSSKKDIDFVRGILVALSQMENSPYKIDLKVIDGRVAASNLTDTLDVFEPNLIVSTADKTFPAFLADYGTTNQVQVVNVFDLKNDLFEDNSSMIQILPPSTYFNDHISSRLYRDNRRRKFYAVGEIDENDGVGFELMRLFEGDVEKLSLEDFGSLQPDIMESILIYSFASKKEEVSDFLKNVENLDNNNPGLTYKIVGRSSWIALLDDFEDQFHQYRVEIPSRVWLDTESREWKNFTQEYEDLFGGDPVRSIPNFAASGYDLARYFIPLVAENRGDFNQVSNLKAVSSLQNDIKLNRVNNWGGFINSVAYIIQFNPEKEIEIITVE